MGCDIHLFIEVKDSQGIWNEHNKPVKVKYGEYGYTQNYYAPNFRNYKIFEKLAGVRGSINRAIAQPRDIPVDTSKHITSEYKEWGIDAHSASWLMLSEVDTFFYNYMKCIKVGMALEDDYYSDYAWFYNNVIQRLKEIDAPRKNIRLVFWFDN